jgi:protein-L-isoaspartate(D-aspartate) O-methyltransferase
MVDRQIAARGIRDTRVLQALTQVPRHRFVPPALTSHAYADHAMSIGEEQTISQPYMVAVMTEALGLEGPERVLEVGTGSGYQAAVLAELAHEVFSVERIPSLADAADALLRELGYANVRLRTGDGSEGWPEEAPFDAILVTAGAPAPPPSLMDQLSPDGGRLVAPVGDRDLQRIVRVERSGSSFTKERLLSCRFVPLLGAEGWPEA